MSLFKREQGKADELPHDDFSPRSRTVRIETESGTINYRIREFLASERNELLFETGRLLGASTGSLIKSYIENAQEWQAIGLIVHGLYTNATPSDLVGFIRDLIKEAVESPANAADKFDEFFTRYYDHQWPLLAAIYEQNFGSSITAIKKKLFDSGLLTPVSSGQSEPEPEEKPPSSKRSKTASIKPNFSNGK